MRQAIRIAAILIGVGQVVSSFAAGGFDGTWNVEVTCSAYGEGEGYVWNFPAQVRSGHLSGKWVSSSDSMNYGVLTGNIDAGGDALLTMNGRTGPSSYNIHHEAPHTTIHYTASAHFDATTGSGKRDDQRPCGLGFSKR